MYTEYLVVNGGNSLGSGCHYLAVPEDIKTKDSETGKEGETKLHFEPAQMGGGGACAGSGFEDKIAGNNNSSI